MKRVEKPVRVVAVATPGSGVSEIPKATPSASTTTIDASKTCAKMVVHRRNAVYVHGLPTRGDGTRIAVTNLPRGFDERTVALDTDSGPLSFVVREDRGVTELSYEDTGAPARLSYGATGLSWAEHARLVLSKRATDETLDVAAAFYVRARNDDDEDAAADTTTFMGGAQLSTGVGRTVPRGIAYAAAPTSAVESAHVADPGSSVEDVGEQVRVHVAKNLRLRAHATTALAVASAHLRGEFVYYVEVGAWQTAVVAQHELVMPAFPWHFAQTGDVAVYAAPSAGAADEERMLTITHPRQYCVAGEEMRVSIGNATEIRATFLSTRRTGVAPNTTAVVEFEIANRKPVPVAVQVRADIDDHVTLQRSSVKTPAATEVPTSDKRWGYAFYTIGIPANEAVKITATFFQ